MQPSIPQVIVAVVDSDCRHWPREGKGMGSSVLEERALSFIVDNIFYDKDPGPAGGSDMDWMWHYRTNYYVIPHKQDIQRTERPGLASGITYVS